MGDPKNEREVSVYLGGGKYSWMERPTIQKSVDLHGEGGKVVVLPSSPEERHRKEVARSGRPTMSGMF